MGLNKKGLFFTWDAIIALIIIFVSILIAYPLISQNHPERRMQQDLVSVLSSVPIGEFDNPYAASIVASGEIDGNKSVLESLGILHIKNSTEASLLAESILAGINTSSNVGIWYGSDLIASKGSMPFENAKNIYVARQGVSGISGLSNGSGVTGFSSRTYLSNNAKSKYFYFGGYVGDGNITIPIDYTGDITDADIEVAISGNFSVSINSNFSGNYAGSSSDVVPVKYPLPLNNFVTGRNLVLLSGNNLHVSGGYLKVSYSNFSVQTSPTEKKYLPGINGIINVYDGLEVPGSLSTLKMLIHYNSSYNTFVTLGNVTVYNGTSDGVSPITLSNSDISSMINYNSISNTTVPLRVGINELVIGYGGGNADVILITDVSGSMAWRMNSDGTDGFSRNCSDPLLNSASTSRISVAKCVDMNFARTILESSGNRVGLVSFASDADSYISLTANQTLINNTINKYTASGSTCISCAINRAYGILKAQSGSNRTKFIITMTDGVANVRSTTSCNDLYAEGSSSSTIAGGAGGILMARSGTAWIGSNSLISNSINGIDIVGNLGFGVGDSGKIIKWDRSSWSVISSPLSSDLNGVSIFNNSLAIGVGDSGKIIKWDGSSWSSSASISHSPDLYGVDVYSPVLMFAVGIRGGNGKIYKSTDGGSSWSEDYSGGDNLRGIKIISLTNGYAVGLNGHIIKWNGNSWSAVSSPTSRDLYSLEAYNSTLVFAVGGDSGSSLILSAKNNIWSSSYSDGSGDSLMDIAVSDNKAYAIGLGGSVFEYDGSSWSRNWNVKPAYSGNETSGITCQADEDTCSEQNSYPGLNANYSSCRANSELNSTVHSIGFGPVASCSFGASVLQSIASCGNGTYFSSDDAATLQNFYSTLANSIVNLTYKEQTSSALGSINTMLYPDSYIELNYSQRSNPVGLSITLEKNFDNASFGVFSVPSSSRLLDAHLISYSGAKWTSLASINGKVIYNLSQYGSKYNLLGDPYSVGIPVNTSALNNTVYLATGVSPQNQSIGSLYNKIIYTISRNVSAYSRIVPLAEGCKWNIEFEDGSNASINIPQNYSGTRICYYNSNSQSCDPEPNCIGDSNDALQIAAYNLFKAIDSNDNNLIDFKFSQNDISISYSEVNGVPFTWSTEAQIRAWY